MNKGTNTNIGIEAINEIQTPYTDNPSVTMEEHLAKTLPTDGPRVENINSAGMNGHQPVMTEANRTAMSQLLILLFMLSRCTGRTDDALQAVPSPEAIQKLIDAAGDVPMSPQMKMAVKNTFIFHATTQHNSIEWHRTNCAARVQLEDQGLSDIVACTMIPDNFRYSVSVAGGDLIKSIYSGTTDDSVRLYQGVTVGAVEEQEIPVVNPTEPVLEDPTWANGNIFGTIGSVASGYAGMATAEYAKMEALQKDLDAKIHTATDEHKSVGNAFVAASGGSVSDDSSSDWTFGDYLGAGAATVAVLGGGYLLYDKLANGGETTVTFKDNVLDSAGIGFGAF